MHAEQHAIPVTQCTGRVHPAIGLCTTSSRGCPLAAQRALHRPVLLTQIGPLLASGFRDAFLPVLGGETAAKPTKGTRFLLYKRELRRFCLICLLLTLSVFHKQHTRLAKRRLPRKTEASTNLRLIRVRPSRNLSQQHCSAAQQKLLNKYQQCSQNVPMLN